MSADLELRPLQGTSAEMDLMARWLGDPRVCEFLEGSSAVMSRADVEEMYSPGQLREDGVFAGLIVFQGEAIGYAQWYPVDRPEDYNLDTNDGTWAFDLFIGEPAHWGKGIGTRVVSDLLAKIFAEHGASRVVVDPHLRNARAIKCYTKAGFRKIKILKAHELYEGAPDDCWLMSARPGKTIAPAAGGAPSS